MIDIEKKYKTVLVDRINLLGVLSRNEIEIRCSYKTRTLENERVWARIDSIDEREDCTIVRGTAINPETNQQVGTFAYQYPCTKKAITN